jgi:hypothetical protein
MGRSLSLALLVCAASCLAQNPDPNIIVPNSKPSASQKVGPAPSSKLASSTRPPALQSLGPIAEKVAAYFAMDDVKTGGLTWSRGATHIYPSPTVVSKSEGGATYLDFSAPHSKLTFSPAYKVGTRFSLAAWAQLPGASEGAAIWQGAGGDYLTVKKTQVLYWTGRTGTWGVWAQTKEPLTGWHHVALVVSGRKVQAFLDGTPLAVVEDLDLNDLSTVGNHRSPAGDHQFMAAGIDEQLFISASLTPQEIVSVMNATRRPGAKP